VKPATAAVAPVVAAAKAAAATAVATAAEVTVAAVPAVVMATAVAATEADTVATVDTVGITTTDAETPATNLERARDRGPSSRSPRVEKPARRRLIATVVWGALVFGAAGSVLALGSRGGAEVFQYEQSSRSASATESDGQVSAAHVAAVVAQAPEPVIAVRRTRPAQVRCLPGDGAVLRDPWSCSIVYRDGTRAHYVVTVEPDGHYRGTGTGIITGCCVRTPALD
jgi:hypothetical protein